MHHIARSSIARFATGIVLVAAWTHGSCATAQISGLTSLKPDAASLARERAKIDAELSDYTPGQLVHEAEAQRRPGAFHRGRPK